MASKYYTTKEAAEILGVKPTTFLQRTRKVGRPGDVRTQPNERGQGRPVTLWPANYVRGLEKTAKVAGDK